MTAEEIQAKLNQAEELKEQANYNDAEQLCREVLESLDEGDELTARALGLLADTLRLRGEYTDAQKIAEDALRSAQKAHSKGEAAKAMNLLGRVHHSIGDYSQAMEYYVKTLAAYDELGMNAEAARVTGNIGSVHMDMGDLTRALEYMAAALATAEALGAKSETARVTGNIGIVHKEMGDFSRALEYMTKARTAHEELGMKALAASVTGNIGIVYASMGDFTQALEYMASALAAHEELGIKPEAANVTGHIGTLYAIMGDYTHAYEYMSKALAAHEELGDVLTAAISTANIGSLYSDKNFEGYDVAKAEEMLLKALSISEEFGVKQHVYHVHKLLAVLYEQQKRWKKHSLHFKKYHETYLEVQSEEATKQAQLMEHRRKVEEAERDRQIKLARFQEQEKILHNILPSTIADRLVAGEKTIVDSFQSVSVLFADIVGFTKLSQRITPEQLVAGLDSIFNAFDHLSDKYGCEKIKTIGDCYMVVSGLPDPHEDHAIRLASLALEMIDVIRELPSMADDVQVNMRIGVHSGSVVAGIIGKNKYAYDLWGDAVNTASRMESHGESGRIHCSEEFVQAVRDSSFHFTERGEMDIKGKGRMKTYFLENV